MSQKGIKLMSDAFLVMQQTRMMLLRGDKQDIAMGQLLETATDVIKVRFAELTLEPKSKVPKRALRF